jgi:hypothetical protein
MTIGATHCTRCGTPLAHYTGSVLFCPRCEERARIVAWLRALDLTGTAYPANAMHCEVPTWIADMLEKGAQWE